MAVHVGGTYGRYIWAVPSRLCRFFSWKPLLHTEPSLRTLLPHSCASFSVDRLPMSESFDVTESSQAADAGDDDGVLQVRRLSGCVTSLQRSSTDVSSVYIRVYNTVRRLRFARKSRTRATSTPVFHMNVFNSIF